MLAVEGRIQVSTYEKDGKRRWDIHVVAGRIEFMGNKHQEDILEAAPAERSFNDIGTEVSFSDEDLPF